MNKEEAQEYLRVLGGSLQQQHLMGEILVNDGVVVLLDIGRPEEHRYRCLYGLSKRRGAGGKAANRC